MTSLCQLYRECHTPFSLITHRPSGLGLLVVTTIGHDVGSLCVTDHSGCYLQQGEVEKKYAGLLEKKWTSVIRLQKKVTFTSLVSV